MVLDQLVLVTAMIDVAVGAIVGCNVLGISTPLFEGINSASILPIHLSCCWSEVFREGEISPFVFPFVATHLSVYDPLVVRPRHAGPDLSTAVEASALSLIVHNWHAVLPHAGVDVKHILHFSFSESVAVLVRALVCTSSSVVFLRLSRLVH